MPNAGAKAAPQEMGLPEVVAETVVQVIEQNALSPYSWRKCPTLSPAALYGFALQPQFRA